VTATRNSRIVQYVHTDRAFLTVFNCLSKNFLKSCPFGWCTNNRSRYRFFAKAETAKVVKERYWNKSRVEGNLSQTCQHAESVGLDLQMSVSTIV